MITSSLSVYEAQYTRSRAYCPPKNAHQASNRPTDLGDYISVFCGTIFQR